MRKLILDTETTGLDFESDRIIEIACVELFDDNPTGEVYHKYFSPGDIIISEHAEEIHGLSNKFLKDFETFEDNIDNFIGFIKDSPLIIHNAQFDISMINQALQRKNHKKIKYEDTICTLEMAKKKFPGSKNNLNALCRRFNISLEEREKHGALTDCRLLLDVYIELIGGKQEHLTLNLNNQKEAEPVIPSRSTSSNHFKINITEKEISSHDKMVKKLKNPIWN